jgi:hypothetical protein
MVAAYPTVGVLVAPRHPSNAVGWLLCVVGLAIAVETFTDKYAPYADAIGLAGAEAAAFLNSINPGVLLAIFVPLLFPDGRLPSRRWRPVLWLGGARVVLYVVDAALEPGGSDPLEVELPSNVYGALVVVGIGLLIVGILGAATSVALRLWRARGQERQQILHEAERRNRSECVERRPRRCGKADDATGPRLAVVAHRYSAEG